VFPIYEARFLAPGIKRFVIHAPRIARRHQAGQFVIVRLYDEGERIPLTIESSDAAWGTISVVVQAVGKTTNLMNALCTGDGILDVVGPLGKPSEIANFGTVVVMGGGVGTGVAYPTAAALKKAGNRVISILGAKTRELVILEQEMRSVSDEVFVTTDDGSYAEKGFVTDKLRRLIGSGTKIDLVLAAGPIPMMKAVADVTKAAGIRTIVSLNPIMIDGTGMCGGCRVLINNESKFACVDGPEFEAHEVNFEVLMQRNSMYRAEEKQAMEDFQREREELIERVRSSCAQARETAEALR
jgi:ferredoxin/flavodoxin---NADP+ reductase